MSRSSGQGANLAHLGRNPSSGMKKTSAKKPPAKASQNDLAIQYLKKALEEGFHDKKKLEQDPEFQAMRDLPEFKQLLASEPRVL